MGLFGGLVGGPIASLVDYHAPPIKRFWLFIIPEFIGFTCAGITGILWKIKEKAIMTENCADIFKVFRAYKLSVCQ
jgi:hypothetical protein